MKIAQNHVAFSRQYVHVAGVIGAFHVDYSVHCVVDEKFLRIHVTVGFYRHAAGIRND